MKLSIQLFYRLKLVFSWLYGSYCTLDNLETSKHSLFEDSSGNLVKTYKETNIFYLRVLAGAHLGLYTLESYPDTKAVFYPLLKTKKL